MRDIVTVDLDSTTADTGHRHRLLREDGTTDWNAYSLACEEDVLIEATRTLVRILAESHDIHYVTGRTVAAQEATERWLSRHEMPIHGLWMDDTPDADHITNYGSHAHYKLARIRQVEEATGQKVVLHVDDWSSVKVVLEANGVHCLCVRTPQEVIEQTTTPSTLA